MIDKRTELMCRAYESTKHLMDITYAEDYSQQIIEKLEDPSALLRYINEAAKDYGYAFCNSSREEEGHYSYILAKEDLEKLIKFMEEEKTC